MIKFITVYFVIFLAMCFCVTFGGITLYNHLTGASMEGVTLGAFLSSLVSAIIACSGTYYMYKKKLKATNG